MKKKIIITTLEEYEKDFLSQCKKEGIISTESGEKNMKHYCLSMYYLDISDAIRNRAYITDCVYKNVPDLHYWIYKSYLLQGKNIIIPKDDVDNGNFEILDIEMH